MSDEYDWLPSRCRFEDFGGDWDAYEEELFNQFQGDWEKLKPHFHGQPVGHAREPFVDGKPEAFWHLTHAEDGATGDRTPDLRRCECLRWARVLISEAPNREEILTWRERHQKGLRRIFALDDFSYIVVVAERKNGRLFLVTAYYVDRPGSRKRLRKQYERSLKKGGPA